MKKLPYQFQPQFYGFPFGYNGKPTYGIYSSTDGFSVGDTRISGLFGKGDSAMALGTFPGTSEFGYGTIKEAETECDRFTDCLYIVNIPPPPGTIITWHEGKAIGEGMCITEIAEDDTWQSEEEAKKMCYRKATAIGTNINVPDKNDAGGDCVDVVAAALGIDEIENRKPDAVSLSRESATVWKCWAQWNVDSTVEQKKESGSRYLWWSTPWQIEASKDTDSGPGRFYLFAGYSNIREGSNDPETWYEYYLTIYTLPNELEKVCQGESAMWNFDGKEDGGKTSVDYQGASVAFVQISGTNTEPYTGIEPFFVGQTLEDKLGGDKWKVIDTLTCKTTKRQYALVGLSGQQGNPANQEGLLTILEPKMKIIVPKYGHTVYTKVATYKDSISYVPEFSEKYVSGGAFSNACGGNQDYCQQVGMDAGGSNKNEDATAVYSYRLGCSQCDVKNVFSIYSEKASVGDVYPIPGFDLGIPFLWDVLSVYRVRAVLPPCNVFMSIVIHLVVIK